jgi:hypothetical protein
MRNRLPKSKPDGHPPPVPDDDPPPSGIWAIHRAAWFRILDVFPAELDEDTDGWNFLTRLGSVDSLCTAKFWKMEDAQELYLCVLFLADLEFRMVAIGLPSLLTLMRTVSSIVAATREE